MLTRKYLYHYSSKKAIDSIYETQTIWLTNANDFDDEREKHLLKEVYAEVVKELKNNSIDPFYKQLASEMQFSNSQTHFIGFGNSVINENGYVYNNSIKFQVECEAYIFCMSYDDRNGYLKEEYASDSNKILKFDNDRLYRDSIDFLQKEIPTCFEEQVKKEKYLEKLGQHIYYSSTKYGLVDLNTVYFKWGNVVYDRNKQKEIIRSLIVDYHDRFYKYSDDTNEKTLQTYINTLLYDLELGAYYMKKEDPFSYEKEFRLILIIPKNYSKVFCPDNKSNTKKMRIEMPVHFELVDYKG
jgi:hypothetical protein